MTDKEREALNKRNAKLEHLKRSARHFFPQENLGYIQRPKWQKSYLEEFENKIDEAMENGTDTFVKSLEEALKLIQEGHSLFFNDAGIDYTDKFRIGKPTRHQILAREVIATLSASKVYYESIKIALNNIDVFTSFDEENRFSKIFEQITSNSSLSSELALSQENTVETAVEDLYLNLKEKIEKEINVFLAKHPKYIRKKPMMYNMTMWFLSEFSDLGMLIKNAFYTEKKDSKLTESEMDEYSRIRNALQLAHKKYIEQSISSRTI